MIDDKVDIAAVGASVSRFLAVESCGQCTPCKQDSLLITDALDAHRARRRERPRTSSVIRRRVDTVTFGARCSLATQEQVVIASLLETFGAEIEAQRRAHRARPARSWRSSRWLELRDGVATLDAEFARKQPDWTFGDHWSGQSPADRLDDHRAKPENL